MTKCSKGYTEKSGECVKSKKHKSSSRKSYNPFKMWLPYIWAVIGLIFLQIEGMKIYNFFYTPLMNWFSNQNTVVGWLIGLIHIVLGFLLGWGIQSLWRKFKK